MHKDRYLLCGKVSDVHIKEALVGGRWKKYALATLTILLVGENCPRTIKIVSATENGVSYLEKRKDGEEISGIGELTSLKSAVGKEKIVVNLVKEYKPGEKLPSAKIKYPSYEMQLS